MPSSLEVIGQVVSGSHGEILLRQKSGQNVELGDLLVCGDAASYHILQVYNLKYGSQIPQQVVEMTSGLDLEDIGGEGVGFMEKDLRNYVLAEVKSVAFVEGGTPRLPKSLPHFFSKIRKISEKDIAFFSSKADKPLMLGNIRSGSKMLNIPVVLDGEKVLTHHILIPATTGRGKSNLVKSVLWNLIPEKYCGILVLDPHDEYYGRASFGLKDHPQASEQVVSYSPRPARGALSLLINLSVVKPRHFGGVAEFSEAQKQAMEVFYARHGAKWLESLLAPNASEAVIKNIYPETIGVLQRKLGLILNIYADDEGKTRSRGSVFTAGGGEATVKEIVKFLEEGKKVIIDTSSVGSHTEILIGSIISNEIFDRYRHYTSEGVSGSKPVVSIVIEEAPRVLGSAVLAGGGNIFSTIAREGRKFRLGLIAVTQLSSIIPREILTNMNTKIILGNELASERQAIIDSAAQDLSTDSHAIASLDKGEAIVSSVFTKFAVPIMIPKFEDFCKVAEAEKKKEKILSTESKSFSEPVRKAENASDRTSASLKMAFVG